MVTAPVSLLTVMAHADDAELWAGGTIAVHTSNGCSVTIAVPRSDPVRDAEAAAGAQILGASLRHLADLCTDTITALLSELRPDIVITRPPDDMHPDHQACSARLLAALPQAVITTGSPRRVYHCDRYNNLSQAGTPLNLPVIIDITIAWKTKQSALSAHASQPIASHSGPMAETLARLRGARIGTAYAEAFRPATCSGDYPQPPASDRTQTHLRRPVRRERPTTYKLASRDAALQLHSARAPDLARPE